MQHLKVLLQKIERSSTFSNKFFQLPTDYFDVRQVCMWVQKYAASMCSNVARWVGEFCCSYLNLCILLKLLFWNLTKHSSMAFVVPYILLSYKAILMSHTACLIYIIVWKPVNIKHPVEWIDKQTKRNVADFQVDVQY